MPSPVQDGEHFERHIASQVYPTLHAKGLNIHLLSITVVTSQL